MGKGEKAGRTRKEAEEFRLKKVEEDAEAAQEEPLSAGSEASDEVEKRKEASDKDTSSALKSALDQLADFSGKKSSAASREVGMKSLLSVLSSKYCSDALLADGGLIIGLLEEVESSLGKSGRSDSEKIAACRCAGAAAVSVAKSERSICGSSFSSLRKTVDLVAKSSSAESISLVVEAIHLRSLLNFLFDAAISKSSLSEIISRIHKSTPVELRSALIRSISLQLSGSPDSQLFGLHDDREIERPIVLCLEDPNLDCRLASGELLSVIFEGAHRFARGDEEEEEGGESSSDAAEEERREGVRVRPNPSLLELLESLSDDSSKHRSKKDRKEQKKTFRDVLPTVESGEDASEEILRIAGTEVVFDSWAMKVQMEAIQHYVGRGFNEQIVKNPFLHELFRIDEREFKRGFVKRNKTEKVSRDRDVRSVASSSDG